MFGAIQWGGPGGEAPSESRAVWGAARPPNEGNGRGDGTVNGFWELVPSRGMVKVGLIYACVTIIWESFGSFEDYVGINWQSLASHVGIVWGSVGNHLGISYN